MNLSTIKGRLGEALVESIFRQSGYTIARTGREAHVEQLLMVRGNEHAPDFLARRMAGDHRLLAIEVKYRRNLLRFLQGYAAEAFAKAKQRCPELYVVLVTDRPEAGSSCFQVIALDEYSSEAVPAPIDLYRIPELRISRRTVASHEAVAKRLFAALSARPGRGMAARPARPASRRALWRNQAGAAATAGATESRLC